VTTSTITVLAALLGPAEREIDCDECFESLDVYVEQCLAGEDADQAVPGMRAHLAGCPACADEHGSLTSLVRAEARGAHP
jgi:hypothetical protein